MRRTVFACIATALLVGGGTATARVLITSSDIKDGTIKGADIKKGAITYKDIKESTITRDRLEKKVRRLLKEQGEPGPKGDVGPAGPTGLVNSTFDADPGTTTAAVQANFGDFTGGSLIRDLTLPAGSYHIEATSSVRGATDGPAAPALNTRVRCNLVDATAGGINLDTAYQDFFQPDEASPGFREPVEVGVLAKFDVQTKVELRCYSVRPGGGTNAGQVPSSKILATQVATITAGH
jgi:hypothetical protein